MTKSRTAATIAVSLALATGFTVAQTAYAPQASLAADAKKPPTLSPKMKPLLDALNLVKEKKLPEALAKAQEAEKVAGKTAYETYVTYQVLANIYQQQKDYANMAKALESEQATGEMSPQESTAALKNITLINYQLKNYPKTIEVGGKYLKDSPNDADIIVMVAQAQYLSNNFKATSDGIHAAIKVAQSAGQPIKEDWLQLLMSSESKMGNDAGIMQALQQIITVDPKEEYWKNLIAYTERTPEFKSNTSTKTTLDLYLLKFQVGTITAEKEYTDMVELSLQNALPGEAKKVMDKGMAAGVLGQGAQKDRETRLATLATTQAATDQKTLDNNEAEARKAKTGDALVSVGEAYWSYGMYDKAVDAIQAGIAKGVTNGDDAKLRLAIVYVSAGKRSQAADALKGVPGDSVAGRLGQLWLLAASAPPKKA